MFNRPKNKNKKRKEKKKTIREAKLHTIAKIVFIDLTWKHVMCILSPYMFRYFSVGKQDKDSH